MSSEVDSGGIVLTISQDDVKLEVGNLVQRMIQFKGDGKDAIGNPGVSIAEGNLSAVLGAAVIVAGGGSGKAGSTEGKQGDKKFFHGRFF